MIDLTKDTVDVLLQLVTAGGGGGVQPTGEITILQNGKYDVSEFASADVQVGGGGDNLKKILIGAEITDTIDLTDTQCTEIAANALFGSASFKGKVVLPATCKTIGASAFRNCGIDDINLDHVTGIGEYAFCGNSSVYSTIKKVTLLDKVNHISGTAFSWCKSLQEFTALDWEGSRADSIFYSCSALRKVYIRTGGFAPLGSNSFYQCSYLKYLLCPDYPGFSNSIVSTTTSMRALGALAVVDGGLPSTIGDTFYECRAIKVYAIRSSSVASLTASSNFGTYGPLSKGTGYVIVPRSLIASYQTATNWATLYAAGTQFIALEDYTLDGTTTGDLDLDKIDLLLAA